MFALCYIHFLLNLIADNKKMEVLDPTTFTVAQIRPYINIYIYISLSLSQKQVGLLVVHFDASFALGASTGTRCIGQVHSSERFLFQDLGTAQRSQATILALEYF